MTCLLLFEGDWLRATYDLLYINWDANDVYPQPYVHTTRDVHEMVAWIDEAAEKSGQVAANSSCPTLIPY